MNGRTVRNALRWFHIILAISVGAGLYSPLSNNDLYMWFVLWIGIPITALTGIAMWKQGALMKALNKRNDKEVSFDSKV